MRGLSVCFYDSIAALVEQFKASVKVFEIYCKIIKDNITTSISAALENVVMFFAAFVVLSSTSAGRGCKCPVRGDLRCVSQQGFCGCFDQVLQVFVNNNK